MNGMGRGSNHVKAKAGQSPDPVGMTRLFQTSVFWWPPALPAPTKDIGWENMCVHMQSHGKKARKAMNEDVTNGVVVKMGRNG